MTEHGHDPWDGIQIRRDGLSHAAKMVADLWFVKRQKLLQQSAAVPEERENFPL